jgi:hypothetical protein
MLKSAQKPGEATGGATAERIDERHPEELNSAEHSSAEFFHAIEFKIMVEVQDDLG